MNGIVVAVARDARHRFSKALAFEIRLIAGQGVAGDAHAGATVKHRSRVAKDPDQPNLRQVHLLPAELFDELEALGHSVGPADLGENITTRGIDLIALPRDTLLDIGEVARVRITGLRNPCVQIERFQPGLLAAIMPRDAEGKLERKAGVMGVVVRGGDVRPSDTIRVTLPAPPYVQLAVV